MQTDFRKDIRYFKEQEQRLLRRLIKEQNKLDKSLELIKQYIEANKHLDIEQLVEEIIYRGWVTKDKMKSSKLYESTKDLVEDFLTEQNKESLTEDLDY